jgi:hypothetical protein
MTESFQIAKDLKLPREAATWTFAVLAIKGAGKTYDAGDLAEEMVKAGIPIVVIDGMGIWWGIRVGVEGHKGLPVVVFGGQHKDLALPMKRLDRVRETLDEDKMRLMVKAILEARISAILDTSELSKGMQRRVVATFVNELNRLNANFGVRHVFIEEADMWCPQRGLTGDVAVSAGAIDDLVRRGGNWNLGCTLITQRSAVLNKDVLTQANCLIVLRILHEIDKKAVRTWVESVANPKDPKIAKWYDSLRELENGEAYVWHPEKPEIFKRVMFRRRETLHATREYFRKTSTEKQSEALDVTEFIDKFRNVFEPKPKPVPEVAKPLPIISMMPESTRTHIPTYAPTHTPTTIPVNPPESIPRDHTPKIIPQDSDTARVQQVLPNVVLEKLRPTAQLPADLLANPPTPLARVLVVLTNHEGREDRWTISRIRLEMQKHAWPWDDIEEAVAELTRWEILRKQSNNYLRFYRDRVQVVDRLCNVAVS